MNEVFRPTRLTVDLDAIASNVRLLRGRCAEGTGLMAVVKADAYGHGGPEVAETVLANGADSLAVAIPEEGARLREAGVAAPILVLGGITETGAKASALYGLAQTVYDTQTIRWIDEAARGLGVRMDVHIKVDSGMGRVGVRDGQALDKVAQAALSAPHVRLAGVFTHFAAADEADLAYTLLQNRRFAALAAPLKKALPRLRLHAANSAALLRCLEAGYDLARPGIALYLNPRLPDGAGEGIRDAMRWTSAAVQVKDIQPGDTVGYGRAFTAARPTRVMTLPVGYADGYHRAIGGRGRALVRGRSAPVIGRVCMDQAMLDVTDIPGAAVGDEAVLLGSQGEETITAREMGEWCGMTDYEILLSPTARVPRTYVSGTCDGRGG